MAVYGTFRSIKLRKKDGYHTLILLTDVSKEKPLNEDMASFQEQLVKDNTEPCVILFDSLLVRRSPNSRFFEVPFDGSRLLFESWHFTKIEQEHPVREHSSKALAKNKKLLADCFLKKSQKRQVMRGEIL